MLMLIDPLIPRRSREGGLAPDALHGFEMAARWLSHAQIQPRPGVNTRPVDLRRVSIYRRLAVDNTTEAAIAYLNREIRDED
jgi:hypothetical protein